MKLQVNVDGTSATALLNHVRVGYGHLDSTTATTVLQTAFPPTVPAAQ